MATAKKNTSRKTAALVSEVASSTSLEEIVEATKAGSFVYTAPSVHVPLIEAGHAEINPAMSNEAGELATRATEKGIETMNTTQETAAVETVAAPVAASSGFAIEAGVPMPSISGRGRTGTTYPFDKMEPGHSFFVPNSEDKPNAAKSLASTVSSATARYSVPAADGSTKVNKAGEQVPVMVETRKFVVRSVEENGVKGARVWRTA
jgi:hypothetical protein